MKTIITNIKRDRAGVPYLYELCNGYNIFVHNQRPPVCRWFYVYNKGARLSRGLIDLNTALDYAHGLSPLFD